MKATLAKLQEIVDTEYLYSCYDSIVVTLTRDGYYLEAHDSFRGITCKYYLGESYYAAKAKLLDDNIDWVRDFLGSGLVWLGFE